MMIYGDVDWSLLILSLGLFLVIGGAEQAGITQQLLTLAEKPNLRQVVTLLSNIVSNVPAVMLLKGLVPQFHDPHHAWLMGDEQHAGRKYRNHRLRGEHHCGGKSPGQSAHRLSGIYEDRCSSDAADARDWAGLAGNE
jgi:hypothetical protein